MRTLPVLGPASSFERLPSSSLRLRHAASLLVVLAVGCASEEARVASASGSDRPPAKAESVVFPDVTRVAPSLDIAGVVATDLDEPVAGRAVAIVDASGARLSGVTRTDGGFVFAGVVPPYDLRVAAAASGVTTVYMGLGRGDPYVELFERDGPTPSPARQTLRVGLREPSCGAGSCW
ncbi:MAG: hypothetical protein K0S65_3917, partial [Labilithrix sp.]|nr:hypothetical protein [Labilithrix sp.]